MSNEFYTHGSYPATGASGSSAAMRAELDLVSAGFDKLPTMSTNAGKAVVVNGGGTALGVTAGTLTLAGNFTLSGGFAVTLAASAAITLNLPGVSGLTVATLTGTETLTNKTLTSPTLNSPTLVTPALGTPASGNLANCTFPTLNQNTTGSAGSVTGLSVVGGKTLTVNKSLTLDGTDGTTMTFPPASADVGYRNIPQNSQSGPYTTVAADAGKHILHPSADTTARVFTIDSNANVPYPVGTAITFVNQNAAGTLTISITADTMRLAGAGTTGSRTLAANGIATALKITSTEWIISGTNLS